MSSSPPVRLPPAATGTGLELGHSAALVQVLRARLVLSTPNVDVGTLESPRRRAYVRVTAYRFGQGTVGSAVTVSPLRNFTSTLPLNPPFGQVLGTVP